MTRTTSALQAEYEFERNARNEYRQEAELPSLRYEAELRNESVESVESVERERERTRLLGKAKTHRHKMTHRMVGLFGQPSYEYFPLPLVHSFRCSHL